jgi:hypothetical protein
MKQATDVTPVLFKLLSQLEKVRETSMSRQPR